MKPSTTSEFLSRLRSLDVNLFAENGRLRFTAPTGSLTPALRAELAARKDELLLFLREAGVATQASAQSIARLRQGSTPPLSSAQMRLWFLDQLEGGIHYNVHFGLRLSGRLKMDALERALGEILRRHEAMRCVFPEVDGQPVQRVASPSPFSLPVIVLRDLSAPAREAEAIRLAVEEARRPFNLAQGPTWRLTLLALNDDQHILLVTAHHIAMDGWSWGVFLGELRALYRAYANRESSPLGELSVQYGDYAAWHADWLKSESIARQLDYWTRQLAGAPGFLELPSDRPRPAVQTFRGAWYPFSLDRAATIALKNLCQREGVTLFSALLATLQTLLNRYTGQEDILVGTPVANRPRAELEGLIGCFLNTVVLRGNLSGDPTFRELLRQGGETVLDALAHQDVPLEKLIDALQPERNQSYSPLFQVLLVLQNTPMPELEMSGLLLRPFEVDNGTAKFDLTLILTETPEGLAGWIEYATDLFDADRIARLAGHLQALLAEGISHPERRLSQLVVLSADERQQLLVEWNQTAADYPKEALLHGLFEEQARRTPERTALEFERKRWTYAELDARASRIAARLRSLGVGPDRLVGLCVERSPQMVASVLGILKAGGAYVPLDPGYPKERLALVLEDARLSAVLTETSLADLVRVSGPGTIEPGRIICVDEISESDSTLENGSGSRSGSNNLAYVLYTSGSTGKPKGVQIEHKSVVNFLASMRRRPGLSEEDVLVAVTTLSFDIAGLELLLPLTTGARVVLASRETASDGPALAQLLERSGATMMQATPATWRLLLEAGWSGHPKFKILCGGEAWNQELAEQLLPRCGSLWNMYGPTETTIWSAANCVSGGGPVCIAGPIANTQLYIVDKYFQPAPIGVAGELCIGGDGVARGYLNRPELTAERFTANPFGGVAGGRMYRTGDLARYRADGSIEFLGRMDQQVKLRGFRIELGEIEAALGQHPQIRQVVASVREDAAGGPRLVGYVVPVSGQAPSPAALRDWLRSKLPEYMVPVVFVTLEALPLTPNGKVDRKALPDPIRTTTETGSGHHAPRDVLEQQLVQIWENVLRVRPVGLNDNFFDLGGHSLTAVRLFAEVRKQTGLNLPLATLFQAPTVGELAGFLRKDGWSPHWSSLVAIQPGGSKPPLFCVHGGGGNLLLYRDLARHLGSDYPFYGLQSQGLDGEGKYLTTIPEMATHYLNQIRELQPAGPYYLGGFCMGGSVAYEMAQQLHAQTQEVRLVVLFDTYNHNGSPPQMSFGNRVRYLWQKAQFHWANLMQLSSNERIDYLRKKFKGARERELGNLGVRLSGLAKRLGNRMAKANAGIKLEDVNDHAGHAYRPKPYPGPITLIRPQRNYFFMGKPCMGWTGFAAGGLTIVELPVYPGGMFVEPYAQQLAEKLRACIDEAEKPWSVHP